MMRKPENRDEFQGGLSRNNRRLLAKGWDPPSPPDLLTTATGKPPMADFDFIAGLGT